ncbi:MAG: hypothetical protein U0893_08275 [Chloroflexota bacterium]
MAVTLEMYLEHQIVRGDLRSEEGQRPIDLLNGVNGGIIQLSNAWSASLHAEAPPAWLDTVRIKRNQILVMIPRTSVLLAPRIVRLGYVEKRPLHIQAAIGPYVVTGSFYVTNHEHVPLTALEQDVTGRFFVPLTDACLTSQHSTRWKVQADAMFVNRGAVSYTYASATT